jgi:uncharacterized protein YbjT (DUF2867 family)
VVIATPPPVIRAEAAGSRRTVFVTGGTGYLGEALLPALLARGHRVVALARPGSARRLPADCEMIPGDALDAASFAARLPAADTLVHLVGTAHPAPWKAAQFRAVDLRSVEAALAAAAAAGVRHIVYLSAAHPAPVMKAYLAVRAECEARIAAAGYGATPAAAGGDGSAPAAAGARDAGGRGATFLRPWYVLGPGHRWPYLLVPAYAVLARLPATRAAALRLGLVTRREMTAALLWAVENPADGVRVAEVPAIRRLARTAGRAGIGAAIAQPSR